MFTRTAPGGCEPPARRRPSLLNRACTRARALVVFVSLLATAGAQAGLAVNWSMTFSPDTIGPGSTSTLTYTLNNASSSGVRGVSFTNTLPAGVTLADPASPLINCDGVLSAPDGGTTVSLTDGEIPGNGSCVISVLVTSSVAGTHTNLTGDLLSDAGNSGRVSADLTVDPDLPGFSKSFSPSTVGLGGRATLTFTIDNSANPAQRGNLNFTDTLPTGMMVANPPNVINTCGSGTVTAVPGSNSISLGGFPAASVPATTTCTISVDVIAQAVGRLDNLSGDLSSTPPVGGSSLPSGKATATLEVTVSPILFSKTFIDDPSTPGSTTRVEYTIVNRSRTEPLTDIAFTDDFGAVLSGLAATGLPATGWCGPASQLTGTNLFKLSAGSLPPEGSCTFRLPLQVPASAARGVYPSSTSPITARLAGSPVNAAPAGDTLFIDVAPELVKTFLPSTATPGALVTSRFRITNSSPTSTATDIAFIDELPPELISANVPAAGFCGPSSIIVYNPASQFDPARLTVTGAELAPGASCLFDVVFQIAGGASTGTVVNTTEPITATVDGATLTGNAATASLSIVSGPSLTKVFLDNPVVPGQVSRLQYTLSYGAETVDPALDIRFTDDLGAILPGLAAVGLPRTNICGAGSSVSGTSVVDFRGGSLALGASCSFIVDVLVPSEAPVGTITNTTSPVTAKVGGAAVQSGPASADLLISGLTLSKGFLGPAIPGGTVGLEFTITNNGAVDATDISFSDDLDDSVPGLTGVGLPLADICGAGSSMTGGGSPPDSVLVFQGGAVKAGTSCSFTVLVQVPAATPEGSYNNSTSALTATIGGNQVSLPGTGNALEVTDRYLELTKSFTPDNVELGRLTTLEFTLTNIHPSLAVTGISFTDPLPAGLVSIAGTVTGMCGPGSQLSGTTTLAVTVPVLNSGQQCTFTVPVLVPVNTPPGTLLNTTSALQGVISGNPVRGDPAAASLDVAFPFTIRNVRERPNGSVAITWTGTPGRLYCVEWTSDLQNWNRILPAFRIDTGITEWIDSGPPLTPSIPMSVSRRFYRIVEKSNE